MACNWCRCPPAPLPPMLQHASSVRRGAGTQGVPPPAGPAPADAAARLKRQAGVAYAEPNWRRYASAAVDDTYFPLDWGLDNTGQTVNGMTGTPDADIDAPEAWDVTS